IALLSDGEITDHATVRVVQCDNGNPDPPPPPPPAPANLPDSESFIVAPFTCVETAATLCLRDGRFQVTVSWRDFDGGTGDGRSVPLASDEAGLFWFFSSSNYELLVKVLDGCGITDNFWVFSAATTNLRYSLTVIDTETGKGKTYETPLGASAPAITDVEALAVCP
ncbi:MAG: hypothetical protein V3T72_03855, partial [Thermoanaerobaculia bacterium]